MNNMRYFIHYTPNYWITVRTRLYGNFAIFHDRTFQLMNTLFKFNFDIFSVKHWDLISKRSDSINIKLENVPYGNTKNRDLIDIASFSSVVTLYLDIICINLTHSRLFPIDTKSLTWNIVFYWVVYIYI